MRYGHDVTMLWANDQLYAIANHTTQKIKYPRLHRAILPQKKVGSRSAQSFCFWFSQSLNGITSLVLTDLIPNDTVPGHGGNSIISIIELTSRLGAQFLDCYL